MPSLFKAAAVIAHHQSGGAARVAAAPVMPCIQPLQKHAKQAAQPQPWPITHPPASLPQASPSAPQQHQHRVPSQGSGLLLNAGIVQVPIQDASIAPAAVAAATAAPAEEAAGSLLPICKSDRRLYISLATLQELFGSSAKVPQLMQLRLWVMSELKAELPVSQETVLQGADRRTAP